MNYKKITLGASLLGLTTFLLPVVTSEHFSLAPIDEPVADYLDVPSVLALFFIWYGEFALSLLLSLLPTKAGIVHKIKLVLIVLINIYALLVHTSITEILLGNSGLGFGGILYYLCAVTNIFASSMLFKDSGLVIHKEDLAKIAKNGYTIGKGIASVATKVTKAAIAETKKEIDHHKSNTK